MLLKFRRFPAKRLLLPCTLALVVLYNAPRYVRNLP